MKATEQFFQVKLFITLYKVVLTFFKSVDDETDHSNKSCLSLLSCCTTYYVVQGCSDCQSISDLQTLKVGTHEVTSPRNKSRGQVPSNELANFASKSSRKDRLWSLRLVPRIQNSLNFWDKSLRLVPQNASSELFRGLVPSCVPTLKCDHSKARYWAVLSCGAVGTCYAVQVGPNFFKSVDDATVLVCCHLHKTTEQYFHGILIV